MEPRTLPITDDFGKEPWQKTTRMGQRSAAQRSAVLCSAAQRSAAQRSAVQRSAAQSSAVQRSAAQGRMDSRDRAAASTRLTHVRTLSDSWRAREWS